MRAKPGRQTTAEAAVIPFLPAGHRLQPPPNLDREARAIFVELVNACPESHFVVSDRYLLATYCEALVMAHRSSRKLPAQLAIWEKSSRLLAQLSSKLRLCPSSRSDPKTVARESSDWQPSYYDLQRQGPS